jgi:hypothetical protein
MTTVQERHDALNKDMDDEIEVLRKAIRPTGDDEEARESVRKLIAIHKEIMEVSEELYLEQVREISRLDDLEDV